MTTPWLDGPPREEGLYWWVPCDRPGHPLSRMPRHDQVWRAPGGKLLAENGGLVTPVDELRRRWAGPLLPPEPLEGLT